MISRLNSMFAVIAIVLGATVARAAEGAGAEEAKYGDKPNVLFIATDDLNHWVGYFHRNEQTATPNIDRLAARGVRFTHAYCAAPSCTPSRAALMSGLRPGTTGVYENGRDWQAAISPDKCLPARFREGGYEVVGSGKIYHGTRLSEWDDYYEEKGDANKPQGKAKVPKGVRDGVNGIRFAPLDCEDSDLPDWKIADYGIDQLGKKHDKPFFLAVGLHKPHMPWNVPKKWYDKFPLESIKLPPTTQNDLDDVPDAGKKMATRVPDHERILASGRWKDAIQGYLAAIAYTDMNVGRVLDALEKSPHKDNTIVVFWGDHGWHLGEKDHWRKFALWEEATRAPMIWSVPGVTKPNTLCESAVDFMTIYPTLTDLCGLKTPAHVEGKSIRSLLADPTAKWEPAAVTTYMFNNHTVRTDGWRYIRYADGSEELYDEKADPLEYTNLAGKPEQAQRKAELAKMLPTKNAPDLGQKKGAARDE